MRSFSRHSCKPKTDKSVNITSWPTTTRDGLTYKLWHVSGANFWCLVEFTTCSKDDRRKKWCGGHENLKWALEGHNSLRQRAHNARGFQNDASPDTYNITIEFTITKSYYCEDKSKRAFAKELAGHCYRCIHVDKPIQLLLGCLNLVNNSKWEKWQLFQRICDLIKSKTTPSMNTQNHGGLGKFLTYICIVQVFL